jgi:hypothetical protein
MSHRQRPAANILASGNPWSEVALWSDYEGGAALLQVYLPQAFLPTHTLEKVAVAVPKVSCRPGGKVNENEKLL